MKLITLTDELLNLAHRRPLRERLPLLLLVGQTISLAERRGASPTTLRSQREWLRALATETSERAAA